MNDAIEVEDLPEALAQRYLPDPLKLTCVVVPKRVITWISVNVLILGIGIGMLLSGLLSRWISAGALKLGFPIALGVAWLIARTVITRSERRFLSQASTGE